MIRLFKDFLQIIAPPRCVRCLKTGSWLCVDCRHKIQAPIQSCIVCNKKKRRGNTCPSCRNQSSLDGLVGATLYQSPSIRRGIHWLKFKSIRDTAKMFAEIMLPFLPLIGPISHLKEKAVLVPLPLHKSREKRRGFNQAREIANAISLYTDIPVKEILLRSKATYPQAKLPRYLKQDNLSDAFKVVKTISKKVILIDDVSTSGATLETAASALKKAGIKEVWGIVIARRA